jgi:hypothetical protein
MGPLPLIRSITAVGHAGFNSQPKCTRLPSLQVAPEAQSRTQAIASARRQKARSLELRAVLSLSRLYHQQDKKEEAHQMLAEIYGWFTEGFDTVDLGGQGSSTGSLVR